MDGSPLSPPVAEFLATYVGSVGELEVLLLLHDDPARAWTPKDAAARLHHDPAWVAGQLRRQTAAGLLGESDGTWRWTPRDAALTETVGKVAEALRRRPGRVIDAIYARRRSSAERFADAFRLREDGDDQEGSS